MLDLLINKKNRLSKPSRFGLFYMAVWTMGIGFSAFWHSTQVRESIALVFLEYGIIWLLGSIGIGWGTKKLSDHISITQQAEATLRENEERLDLAVKGANLGMWDWDIMTGDMVFSNNSAMMLGYESNDLPHNISTWEMLLHPEDIEGTMTYLENYFKDDSLNYATEFRLKTKSGDWRWMYSMGKVVERDANNQPLRMVGIHMDITERKQAEAALKESEEKYRTMMESTKDLVYICSDDFRIEYANPAMLEKAGANIVGNYCYQNIFKNNEKCSWCRFDDVREGTHVNYELYNPTDRHYYSILNTRIVKSDGGVSKMAIARDITEIKQMSALLMQSEKMASIGQLAAGIAHEINNPMGFISSNLKTLTDYQDDLDRLIRKYRRLAICLTKEPP